MTNLLKKGLNFFSEKLGKKGNGEIKDQDRIFITGAILEKNNSNQDIIAFYLRKANESVNLDANYQRKLATDFVNQVGKKNSIKLDEIKGKLTAYVHAELLADTHRLNTFIRKLMDENILDKNNDESEDGLEKVIAQEIMDRMREHEIGSIVAPEPDEILIRDEGDEENITQAEKTRKLLKEKEKLETSMLKEEKHFKNTVEKINDKYTKLSKELLGGEGKKYDMPMRVQVADAERREKINEKINERIIERVHAQPETVRVEHLIGLKRK